MRKNRIPQLLGMLVLVLLTTTLKAQDKIDAKKQQIDALFQAWNKGHTPGAVVAVIKDGRIIFKNAYGYANLEFDIKNEPSTLFNIASNSKQFTAFALLHLVQEGKIKLEDDIKKYLPELPDFAETIKVKTLAQHTHGIRGITYLLGMAGWNIEDLISRESVLKILKQQEELNFLPETDFSYNNSGYMLLAEIIERVSGKPFHRYLDEIIFKPLEMENTVLFEDYQKVIPNLASPYFFDGAEYKKGIRNFKDIVGNTGIRTTIEDLSKWIVNFEEFRVGNAAIFKALAEPAVLKNGDTIGYSFGQMVSKYKGRQVIHHGGADAGYRSQILRFPDDRLSIIVLTNDGSLNADEKAFRIATIYLENENRNTPKTPNDDGLGLSRVISKEILQKYEGKFELQPGFIMEFNTEEEQLYITATGQGTFPLETLNEKQFQIRRISAIITFVENEDGDFDSLTFKHDGQTSEGKRIKYSIKNADLEKYTGVYYSPELQTSYELILENGALVARHQRQESTILSAIGNHEFSGNTWFFGTLLFQLKEGIAKSFSVNADRVQNLVFHKVDKTIAY